MRLVFPPSVRPGRGAPRSILVLLTALVSTPASPQDSTAAERKTSVGVYTTAQASRGENTYKVNCVSCHATSDYTGETFQLSWLTRTAFDIFDVIRTQMPEDNPGILARQEYVDIVAYIFSLNSYPAGQADLPPDDEGLKKVRIDALPQQSGLGPAFRHGTPHPVGVRRHR
ncbi:MAG TPA: cytochrome c [Gemmatimonadaceae bacterium]